MHDDTTLGAAIVWTAFLGYWLPLLIAFARGHQSRWPIAIVNVFLGWTFVGWVVALAWSASPLQRVAEKRAD